MASPVVLGIDLGTQRIKVAAVDVTSWRLVGTVQAGVRRFTGPTGMFEQDPNDWWAHVRELVPRLLTQEGIAAASVVAIGLSGHMHSLVPLDADGTPVHRCIAWLDTRSATEAAYIAQVYADRLWNPSISAYTAPKLMWLRRTAPESFARMRHAVFAKDYLRYRLTGQVATDLSDASGSQLWDFEKSSWDDRLIEVLGLPAGVFPEVVASTAVAGVVTAEAADQVGLVPGVPVACGAGDVAAAVFAGSDASRDGILCNVGTATQVIRLKVPAVRLSEATGARYLFETGTPGQRFVMGAVPSTGLALDWWARVLGPGVRPEDLDDLASPLKDTGSPPVFLPYLQGTGTPKLDEAPLGAFLWMSADTDRAAMTRAVMEGVAYSIRYCAEALVGSTLSASDVVTMAGGLTKSPRMRALLRGVLPGRIRTRDIPDASLVGATVLAAVAVGAIGSTEEAVRLLSTYEEWDDPDPAMTGLVKKGYASFRDAIGGGVHSGGS